MKYDTIIELPPDKGLRPGMSAEVEVIMAVHEDVITIPVAAVIETDEGDFCWIKTSQGTEGRLLQLGDSNDVRRKVMKSFLIQRPSSKRPSPMH